MTSADASEKPRRASAFGLFALCAVLFAVFVSLGVWQLQRLQWKTSLIERAQRNTVAQALEVHGRADLAGLRAEQDEYRRVGLTGLPDCNQARPVWTATRLGSGYWWMVPVRLLDGTWLWVNRGFITPDALAKWRLENPSGDEPGIRGGVQEFNVTGASCARSAPLRIEGLLRASQTGGYFVRANQPNQGRWYSRHVEQLSESAILDAAVSDWFVDEWPVQWLEQLGTQAGAAVEPLTGASLQAQPAQAHPIERVHTGSPLQLPYVAPDGSSVSQAVAGLTPLQWPNKHLGYALTWFVLACGCVVAAVLALRAKV